MAHKVQPFVSVMFLLHFDIFLLITVQTHDNMELFLFYMIKKQNDDNGNVIHASILQ